MNIPRSNIDVCRFSKVAGAKLSDDNSDIADLSDPNRAMKLSERFGQLYDDEWTNAFEALTDKDQLGMHHKEAIRMLLLFLQVSKKCLVPLPRNFNNKMTRWCVEHKTKSVRSKVILLNVHLGFLSEL